MLCRNLLLALLPLSLAASCTKTTSKSTLYLYDKPPAVIKTHISGKWKVHYAKGGLTGNMITHFDDFIMEFKFAATDSQFAGTSAGYNQRTLIQWRKAADPFHNVDSTYLMDLYKENVYLNSFSVESIINDTLSIAHPVPDGYGFFMTRY